MCTQSSLLHQVCEPVLVIPKLLGLPGYQCKNYQTFNEIMTDKHQKEKPLSLVIALCKIVMSLAKEKVICSHISL